MVKVTIYKKSNETVGFKLNGHAGYAKSGYDIVCAATSMLVLNTINSIEKFTDDGFKTETDEKTALIKFKMTGNITDRSRVLLDSLELGLIQLTKNYSKYISITFKEV